MGSLRKTSKSIVEDSAPNSPVGTNSNMMSTAKLTLLPIKMSGDSPSPLPLMKKEPEPEN